MIGLNGIERSTSWYYAKVLYWDKTGFALWYKRLEKDKFKWPTKLNVNALNLSEQQLHWLFDGFDVLGHQAINYESVAL